LTNQFNPRDVRANVADLLFGRFLSSYRRYFVGGFDIIFDGGERAEVQQ
jgi:hypothetical protein